MKRNLTRSYPFVGVNIHFALSDDRNNLGVFNENDSHLLLQMGATTLICLNIVRYLFLLV